MYSYDELKISVTSNLATVTTADVTNVTYTTATSGGNVVNNGGAAVTSRGVCWSTMESPTIYDSHTSNGSGNGTFTSQLTGLIAGTPYFIRAFATNSAGTAYGSQLSFISVPFVNHAPTINLINNPSAILEDAGFQTVFFSGIGDGDSAVVQNISITAVSSNVNIIPNPTVIYTPNNPTGSLTYTPVNNAYGSATITLSVMDNGGTANGGTNYTTINFIVVVLPVNDPPVANAGPNQTITSGLLVTLKWFCFVRR